MKTIGVRELEEHISEMLHLVQETGETIAVTKDGEVIAHVVPASIPPPWLAEGPHSSIWAGLDGAIWTDLDSMKAEIEAHRSNNASAVDDLRDAWTNFDHLVAELDVHWPEGVSAVDAIRDVRREL